MLTLNSSLHAFAKRSNVAEQKVRTLRRRLPGSSLPAAFLTFFGAILCAIAFAIGTACAEQVSPHRQTLSLDGTWDIEDSVEADLLPTAFHHTAPVPGLAHSASPGFVDVDKYQTKQLLSSLVYYDRYSQADYDKLGAIRGISGQKRNYFWYRRRFMAPARSAVAILKVNKAQFGTVVYLNGVRIGEHDSCFTAAYFDVSRTLRWNRPNELIIRVGAHPGVLPATVSGGTDFEKYRWTPGIYDDVSLIATDNPVITAVQVAPQLASAANVASVMVQTELHNYSERAIDATLQQHIFEWKSGRSVALAEAVSVHLSAGEIRQFKQVVPLPAAHLWSPEDPFLYRLDTASPGDAVNTRFGMREFHFDTVTKTAYLNGRPYFLRGSNIALHRFFEDPLSGTLPWNDAWLKRLLVDIPKKLHWNAFRMTIGPVPDRWLDIADEAGLLVEYEYPVWVGSPLYTQWTASYDTQQMIDEYSEWLRDNWNHPSIFLWDATNESWLPEFSSKVIPAVRSLDLSMRAWEDSYNAPDGADDPVEDHTYFLEALGGKYDASAGGKPFEYADLESMDGTVANPFTKSNHAKILNEYGWMWLNRDGSPTLLTENLYPKLLGPHNNVENRRIFSARMLGAETELWRAYRRYTAVLQFVYLTSSEAGGFTADNFLDVRKLVLEPHFETAMEQAFKPLGVYLNFWHSSIGCSVGRTYDIYMVNDVDRPRRGTLKLEYVDAAGKSRVAATKEFLLDPLGAQSYSMELNSPPDPGQYELQAIAQAIDKADDPTVSIRDVTVQQNAAQM